jgi:hypothetical protein
MNRQEHLLTSVMEECNEVGQRVSKAMRFGVEQVQIAADDRPEQNPGRLTNRERILSEFYDLLASMEMAGLIELKQYTHSDAMWLIVPAVAIEAKKAKIERYLEKAKQHGTLT